jgi:hypothetical protein
MDNGRNRKSERRALGLSVLLHGLVAPLFVALLIGVDDLRPEGPLTASGLFSISILHRPAPAPARPQQRPHTPARPAALVEAPSHSIRTALAPATQRHASGRPTKTRRVALVAPLPTPLPTPTVRATPAATAPSKAVAQAQPTAQGPAPPTEPPATPEPTRAVAFVDPPAGGWGQNFHDPTVLDSEALADLHARYHGAVAHVDVDENGHAERVSIDGPGLDAEAVAALERKLMDIRYVPAECNGLRCAASLELHV